MDPMDYTMDGPSNQGNNNTTPRYQCDQQSSPPAQNSFASQSRDSRHYDPVHESSRWHYGNATSAQVRSLYPTPPSFQHQNWAHGYNYPQMPGIGDSARSFGDFGRPNFGDTQRGNAPYQLPELPPFLENSRAPRAYSDASWNAFESRHAPPSFDNILREVSTGGIPTQPSGLRPSLMAHEYPAQQADQSSQLGQPNTRVPQAGTDRPNRQPASSSSLTESQRTRYSRIRAGLSRHDSNDEMANDRRSHVWNSDEDSASDMENEGMRSAAYREALYQGVGDERSVAAMRGALAASGKRLPTKEALASLEKLKVDELPENDKTCIICYNEFGVSNPEGQTEQPIRLPKCKHIFGDKCIKKWFEDSDSCPYCRDKLPSEVTIKRSGLESSLRLQRERLRALNQRSRQGLTPHVGFFPEEPNTARSPSTPSQFRNDEYNLLLSNHMEAWGGYSPPNRYSSGESPERRRQGRGRVGNGRPGHLMGRPTSTGSARSITQTFNYHQGPPRQYGLSNPTLHTSVRRSLTPGVPRLNGANPESPQTRASENLQSSSPPTPSEEASPPVAVGSGVPASNRLIVDNNAIFPRDGRGEASTDVQQSHHSGSSPPHQRPWDDYGAYGPLFSTSTTLRRPASPEGNNNRLVRQGEGHNNGRENESGTVTVRMPPRWSR